jgi:hypothetical protein
METLSRKCADINSVGSFCDCLSGGETVDPAAAAFCNRAKTDKNITGEDLRELKSALSDLDDDEESCDCDCCC